ncbi:glycosyltransferase 87 family protein [Umezawaea tangerina]|uniref:Alpha-1,2-mannosyltransferase n=1 Tax=Umezawaea tangerina TaxID=84725 RepID=A0A2T0TGE4_9PSEU|nr:glycosyltransferase 87 family protein [Umezawaea tangerina]PRY44693.1 alpha-1,2-mannosyltransferase [Umezawaea tangerina]
MTGSALVTRLDVRGVWWVFVVVALAYAVVRGLGSGLVDLHVYRTGGEVWLTGGRLYDDFPGVLPFTYPPFAAVLFSALALPPWPVVMALWTAAGLALFTVACQVAARHDALPRTGLGLAAASLLLEPVRGTLELGQVNLLLIGLVAADCLLPRTPWPRGLLVGIAAAVKLTPAVFVLFFLSRRRWRPALTAAAAFAACGGLGWALAPRDSESFWFHAVLDPQRVGGLAYSGNQSLHGLLFRLGAPDLLWPVLCVVVLVATAVLLPRVRDDLTAVVAVAAAGLLVSPVSWSHHWVWVAPALLVLRGRTRVVAALVFAVGPHWLLPKSRDRELDWTWWQHVVGNTYVWLALAFLVALLIRGGRAASTTGVGAAPDRLETDPAIAFAAERSPRWRGR